jgi:hypothetical protein
VSETARVGSIEALKEFRVRLMKFAEICGAVLADSESEVSRTIRWVETEQQTFWAGQIRKRTIELQRAEELLRSKTLYKQFDGTRQSAVDEQKAVDKAKVRLREANEKLDACRKWAKRLEKESFVFRGAVQRFSTILSSEVPGAASVLTNMIISLEAYAALHAAAGTGGEYDAAAAGEAMAAGAGSMARAPAAGDAGPKAAAEAEKAVPESILQRPPPPATEIRAAAILVDAHKPPWSLAILDDDTRRRLAAIAGNSRPPGSAQWLVAAAEARGESLIAFERLAPAAVGDSGWCVGPISPAPDAHWQAVRVDDLLAARPDLAEMLALGTGYAVLLGAGGVMAVLDPQGEDLWQQASAAAQS